MTAYERAGFGLLMLMVCGGGALAQSGKKTPGELAAPASSGATTPGGAAVGTMNSGTSPQANAADGRPADSAKTQQSGDRLMRGEPTDGARRGAPKKDARN